jgi:pimeloyl-ACP methyl ester carboxylesterase
MYKEKRIFRSEFVPIRGLQYHVQIWEPAGAPAKATPLGATGPAPLVLVHGWMDVAASYQFMVDAFSDAFAQGRTIIAPDWRGFGQTAPAPDDGRVDNYWVADYLADLDFLLDHYTQDRPIDLVGHSMGGNVVMTYAGVRPSRVRRLVNLEGFDQPAASPEEAPARYAKWMDALKSLQKGELDLKAYDDVAGVARRLMKTNPRLSPDKAVWLANHWAREDESGRWRVLGDAAHKVVSANLYRLEETLALYRRISMPLLAVEASDDSLGKWWKGKFTLAQYHERLKLVPNATVAMVEDAGHMLHHDQPEKLARLIEDFLA